jgi:hypothetical protein
MKKQTQTQQQIEEKLQEPEWITILKDLCEKIKQETQQENARIKE